MRSRVLASAAAWTALSASVVAGVTTAERADAAPCTITGTDGDDVLKGTSGADVICGLGGADLLRGFEGDDELLGGDGDDLLFPGTGANLVRGEAGDDTVRYDDLVTGGIEVRLARGFVTGAASGSISDVENVVGTAWADRLVGTAGPNRIQGVGGDDVIIGRDGADRLLGAEGDDVLQPGEGLDFADGAQGRDTVSYRDITDGGVHVDLGLHRATGASGPDAALAFENAVGTTTADVLIGDDAVNVLNGLPGSDLLDGGAARDVLLGDGDERVLYGGDDDVLVGGTGDDVLKGGPGSDDLAGGGGADALWPGAGLGDRVDGGAAPGDALNGDVVRYDDIGHWAQLQDCSVPGCTFRDWDIVGGGVIIDFTTGQVKVGITYQSAGHYFNLEETDLVADVEAAYATFLPDTLIGGRGPTDVAFCGLARRDRIDTQDGYGGDLFDASGADFRTQDPDDASTTC